MKRRTFLRRSVLAGGSLLAAPPLFAVARRPRARVVILHTNDWHSQIEPFPDDGGRNANRGGATRRALLIEQIRRAEEHVLLFDSGDIFQGTPYFNFFLGELEMKLMSRMGYDAATIGNHDFDGGLKNLAQQLRHASFPLLNVNYDFRGTEMEGKVLPYRVFQRGTVRVGVFGVGIELAGLVPAKLYGDTRYLDPVGPADTTATRLRKKEGCDLVVCLSHLGFSYGSEKIDDVKLAARSANIDLILGGHTHTFLDRPVQVANREGKAVIVNQVGFAGLRLGRLDVDFAGSAQTICVACSNLRV